MTPTDIFGPYCSSLFKSSTLWAAAYNHLKVPSNFRNGSRLPYTSLCTCTAVEIHLERIQPTRRRLLAQVPPHRLPLEIHRGRTGQKNRCIDMGRVDGRLRGICRGSEVPDATMAPCARDGLYQGQSGYLCKLFCGECRTGVGESYSFFRAMC